MKLHIALVLPLVMACSVAFAAPAQQMPLSSIIQQLKTDGYYGFDKIDMERGVYEITVFDKMGHEFKLKVNPTTGVILNKPTPDVASITMEDAVVAVEKAGYTNIKEIEIKHDKNYFKVEALNAQGKKVKLHVDAKTGAVTPA